MHHVLGVKEAKTECFAYTSEPSLLQHEDHLSVDEQRRNHPGTHAHSHVHTHGHVHSAARLPQGNSIEGGGGGARAFALTHRLLSSHILFMAWSFFRKRNIKNICLKKCPFFFFYR
jgi:hypothetical protein